MSTKTDSSSHFFDLNPSDILNVVEKLGFHVTGEYLQLNSYENRVYSIGVEEKIKYIIIKFYRPQRWSKEVILEEHEFLFDLLEAGIQIVPPLKISNQTLFEHKGIFFCLYNKFKGQIPQELTELDLKKIGSQLALIHIVGSQKKFKTRRTFSTKIYGDESLGIIENFVPMELWNKYCDVAYNILNSADELLKTNQFIRIHGDFHKGNILFDSKEFFYTDFDDSCTGPPEQDFWMLFSGEKNEEEFNTIYNSYKMLRNVELNFNLFNILRGLRIIYYAGWIGQRWTDPTFPKLFPQFLENQYWTEEINQLNQCTSLKY